jgi:hypothetical protein
MKMNPHKYMFRVSTGKFLGFIIHEQDIDVDPDRTRVIQKVGGPTYKLKMQKFFDKVNYLLMFIYNLVGKVYDFSSIFWLKNDADFTWGETIACF